MTAGPPDVRLVVDGQPLGAVDGQTLLGALTAGGYRTLHYNAVSGEPRAAYCGMGVCFECVVEVDGVPAVRACMEPVADGQCVVLGRPPQMGEG